MWDFKKNLQSWSFLKINLDTVFNNFDFYAVICYFFYFYSVKKCLIFAAVNADLGLMLVSCIFYFLKNLFLVLLLSILAELWEWWQVFKCFWLMILLCLLLLTLNTSIIGVSYCDCWMTWCVVDLAYTFIKVVPKQLLWFIRVFLSIIYSFW